MLLVILISIIVAICVYYINLCIGGICRNEDNKFKLPLQGFVAPFKQLFAGNFGKFFYTFFSFKAPYLFVIIFIILALLINYIINKFVLKTEEVEILEEEKIEQSLDDNIQLNNEEIIRLKEFKKCITELKGDINNPSIEHIKECSK